VSPPAGTKATLRFSLQGARELAWNVKLLWGKGERVFQYVVAELELDLATRLAS
jgi:hypothetical protein